MDDLSRNLGREDRAKARHRRADEALAAAAAQAMRAGCLRVRVSITSAAEAEVMMTDDISLISRDAVAAERSAQAEAMAEARSIERVRVTTGVRFHAAEPPPPSTRPRSSLGAKTPPDAHAVDADEEGERPPRIPTEPLHARYREHRRANPRQQPHQPQPTGEENGVAGESDEAAMAAEGDAPHVARAWRPTGNIHLVEEREYLRAATSKLRQAMAGVGGLAGGGPPRLPFQSPAALASSAVQSSPR